MKGNIRYRIAHKGFSEYVYRTLKGLSADQRKELTDDDLKIVKSTATINEFATYEQLDRQLLMLTKVGVNWTIRLGGRDESVDQLEFASLDQFDFPEKRMDIINKAAEENLFYMSAHDVMLSSMLSAQNVSTQAYKLSSNSREIVNKVSGVKSVRIPMDEQVTRSVSAYEDLMKLVMVQLNSLYWAKHTLGLEQDEIRILCALFLKRAGALTLKEISAGTLIVSKPAYLKKNMDRLMDLRLVIGDAKKGKRKSASSFYMITPLGVGRVMEYTEYVFIKAFR